MKPRPTIYRVEFRPCAGRWRGGWTIRRKRKVFEFGLINKAGTVRIAATVARFESSPPLGRPVRVVVHNKDGGVAFRRNYK